MNCNHTNELFLIRIYHTFACNCVFFQSQTANKISVWSAIHVCTCHRNEDLYLRSLIYNNYDINPSDSFGISSASMVQTLIFKPIIAD